MNSEIEKMTSEIVEKVIDSALEEIDENSPIQPGARSPSPPPMLELKDPDASEDSEDSEEEEDTDEDDYESEEEEEEEEVEEFPEPKLSKWDLLFAEEDYEEIVVVLAAHTAKKAKVAQRANLKAQMDAIKAQMALLGEPEAKEGEDSGEDEPIVKRNVKNKKGRSSVKKYEKRVQDYILEYMVEDTWYEKGEIGELLVANGKNYKSYKSYLTGKYMIGDGTIKKKISGTKHLYCKV